MEIFQADGLGRIAQHHALVGQTSPDITLLEPVYRRVLRTKCTIHQFMTLKLWRQRKRMIQRHWRQRRFFQQDSQNLRPKCLQQRRQHNIPMLSDIFKKKKKKSWSSSLTLPSTSAFSRFWRISFLFRYPILLSNSSDVHSITRTIIPPPCSLLFVQLVNLRFPKVRVHALLWHSAKLHF